MFEFFRRWQQRRLQHKLDNTLVGLVRHMQEAADEIVRLRPLMGNQLASQRLGEAEEYLRQALVLLTHPVVKRSSPATQACLVLQLARMAAHLS